MFVLSFRLLYINRLMVSLDGVVEWCFSFCWFYRTESMDSRLTGDNICSTSSTSTRTPDLMWTRWPQQHVQLHRCWNILCHFVAYLLPNHHIFYFSLDHWIINIWHMYLFVASCIQWHIVRQQAGDDCRLIRVWTDPFELYFLRWREATVGVFRY